MKAASPERGIVVSDGVLLLHGITRTSASMRPLQRALEAAGHTVLNLDYRSRHMPLDAPSRTALVNQRSPASLFRGGGQGCVSLPTQPCLAESIHPAVSRFAAATPGALHIVAHSMGGLLARVDLTRHRPARLGRVVMLGTPNGGSELADLLRGWPLYRLVFGPAGQQLATARSPDLCRALGTVDYELGILAGVRPLNRFAAALLMPGPNDGRVTVASTRLAGMADHRVVHTSHTRLASHPEAIAATLRFLRDGASDAAR